MTIVLVIVCAVCMYVCMYANIYVNSIPILPQSDAELQMALMDIMDTRGKLSVTHSHIYIYICIYLYIYIRTYQINTYSQYILECY